MADLRPRLPPGVDFIYTLDTTLPVSAGHRGNPEDADRSDGARRSSSCSCSCRTGARRSSRCWRCRSRSSAPSSSSRSWAFRSIRCRSSASSSPSAWSSTTRSSLSRRSSITSRKASVRRTRRSWPCAKSRAPSSALRLILAAVFIPVGLMSGIQGRLNQQFAITIAVSVVISAFNALTLSPALVGPVAAPAQEGTWVAWPHVRRLQPVARSHDTRVCQPEPRPDSKAAHRHRNAGALCRRRGPDRARGCPNSFLPEEDYGYFLMNIQLPPAASLDRTDAVAHKVDDILKHTDGVVNFNTIVGFSLLTRVTASNNAFYFVQLKPWDERHVAGASGTRDRQSPQRSAAIRGAGSGGVRHHAAVDSRPRQPGRVLDVAAGSRRRIDRSRMTISCRSSSPRRAPVRSWPASPPRSRRACRRCS